MSITEERKKELLNKAIELVTKDDLTLKYDEPILDEYKAAVENHENVLTAARLRYCMDLYASSKNISNYSQSRLVRDMKQKGFAFSRQALGHVYTGFRSPSKEMAEGMALVLGTRSEYLLGTGHTRTKEQFDKQIEYWYGFFLKEEEKDIATKRHDRLQLVIGSEIQQVIPLQDIPTRTMSIHALRKDHSIEFVNVRIDSDIVQVTSADYINLIDTIVSFTEFTLNNFAKKNGVTDFLINK